MISDDYIELDPDELPRKYIALCSLVATLTDTTVQEVDGKVEYMLDDSPFEVMETDNRHLNG